MKKTHVYDRRRAAYQVVTVLLGFVAGWRHDFDTRQAAVLNSMVMLYALPLNLFAGIPTQTLSWRRLRRFVSRNHPRWLVDAATRVYLQFEKGGK